MATTLKPLDPATTPQHALRLLPIAAKLLPPEILAARRARVVRSRVIAGLVAVAILLGGYYAFALYQVQEARESYDAAVAEQAALTAQQKDYNEVVQTQAQSTAISARLKTLLADDMRWAGLLGNLRGAAATAGITVTGVSGSLPNAEGGANAGANGQTALPGASTAKVVGTMTITGTGTSKDAVAKYIDELAKIDKFANPYLTSVTTEEGKVQFSAQLDITKQALGGRFTATTNGGK